MYRKGAELPNMKLPNILNERSLLRWSNALQFHATFIKFSSIVLFSRVFLHFVHFILFNVSTNWRSCSFKRRHNRLVFFKFHWWWFCCFGLDIGWWLIVYIAFAFCYPHRLNWWNTMIKRWKKKCIKIQKQF